MSSSNGPGANGDVPKSDAGDDVHPDEWSDAEHDEWDRLKDQVESGTTITTPRVLKWKSTQTMIPAAYSFQMPIAVEEPDCTLSYEFQTEGYDINFAVRLIDQDGDTTDLLPSQRYEASNSAVIGRQIVNGVGTVLLCWDNSYSWFNEKKLAYSVELSLPVNKDEDDITSKRAASALIERVSAVWQAENTGKVLDNAIHLLGEAITGLERQIQELQMELKQKQAHFDNAQNEKKTLTNQITRWRRQIRGLAFLSLNKRLMSRVLVYGDVKDKARWRLVCRKWNQCVTTLENAADGHDV